MRANFFFSETRVRRLVEFIQNRCVVIDCTPVVDQCCRRPLFQSLIRNEWVFLGLTILVLIPNDRNFSQRSEISNVPLRVFHGYPSENIGSSELQA